MKKKATCFCLSFLLVFYLLPNLSYSQSEQNTLNPREYTDCSSSDENTDSGISEGSDGDIPVISQASTTEQAIDISGRISLPCNETAPKGGLSISIMAEQTYEYISAKVICEIPEGKNSAEYTLSVAPGGRPYYIFYRINNSGTPYVETGYFSNSPNYWAADSPSPVHAGKRPVKNINLILQKGAIIKGTVSLPNQEKVPYGYISVHVTAFSDNGTPGNKLDDFSQTAYVRLEEGKNSCTYSIIVNPNPSRKYSVSCILPVGSTAADNCGYLYAYLRDYPSDRLFSIGKATNALDLSIKKGVLLHGIVYLPDGAVAPAGGTYVYVRAGNDKYWNWMRGKIPEGSSSIPYSLFADPDGVLLQHYTYGEDGYFISALYYSTSGNTPDKDKATLITDFSKPIDIEY